MTRQGNAATCFSAWCRGWTQKAGTRLDTSMDEPDLLLRNYTIDEVAEILGCTPAVAVEQIRRGDLPGLKFGRSWLIPAQAFHQRLNELALEVASERRAARQSRLSYSVPIPAPLAPRSRRRIPPPLPSLPVAQPAERAAASANQGRITYPGAR